MILTNKQEQGLKIALERYSHNEAWTCIGGYAGSGKSTLIKMLYREEKPDKGSIIIGGINVAKLKNRKVYVLRRKLGVVFQDFKLLPKLTVYENVAFAMEVLGYDKKEIRKRKKSYIKK